jgi:hypothetical protein
LGFRSDYACARHALTFVQVISGNPVAPLTKCRICRVYVYYVTCKSTIDHDQT